MLRLLGSSGRVVNSLEFCPASLKSVGCFYVCTFFTMECGNCEFANFTLPTVKAFFETCRQNVSQLTSAIDHSHERKF